MSQGAKNRLLFQAPRNAAKAKIASSPMFTKYGPNSRDLGGEREPAYVLFCLDEEPTEPRPESKGKLKLAFENLD